MFPFPSKRESIPNEGQANTEFVPSRVFPFPSKRESIPNSTPYEPVTVRAKIAKTKREVRGGFFPLQNLPKTLLNPYVHYTKRDFSGKVTKKQVTVYVQRQFQLPRRSICKSRFVYAFNYTLNLQKCQMFF